MKVCVVGSGGREHALAHVLARTAEVVVTPGNPGIAAHGITCVATPSTDLDADLFGGPHSRIRLHQLPDQN